MLCLELGASKGEIVYWYESFANRRGYSTKIKDLSIRKYKHILWDKIQDMLEIAGYDIKAIEQELIIDENMIHTAKPPYIA